MKGIKGVRGIAAAIIAVSMNGCRPQQGDEQPVAHENAYRLDEDAGLFVSVEIGVLDNDRGSRKLTAVLDEQPVHGILALRPDGSFDYQPAGNYFGADSFQYHAEDGGLASASVVVALTIDPVNDPPSADGDVYTVAEDTMLEVEAVDGVLLNDSDVEGGPAVSTLVAGPSHGSVTLSADGSFSYAPDADFSGSDSFEYTSGDGELSANAFVTIAVEPVNDAPSAVEDAYTLPEDGTLTVGASTGVLVNDVDAEEDELTAMVVQGPSHGSLVFAGDGTFEYVPTANFAGSDEYRYLASDGSLPSAAMTVHVEVVGVNDPPDAVADAYEVDEEKTLSVPAAAGVLSNDLDVDGEGVAALLTVDPGNGAVSLDPDGRFTYTPDPGFSGTDAFTYIASDGTLDSAPANVTITVADVPSLPLDWVVTAGSKEGDEEAIGVAALGDGAMVVVGRFEDTTLFGPDTPAEQTLSSTGQGDVFIAHYGADGTLDWVVRGGGIGDDVATGVSALSDGSIVVCGWIAGQSTFESTSGGIQSVFASSQDAFLARYSADGTLLWLVKPYGAAADWGHGVAVTAEDRIYLLGQFTTKLTQPVTLTAQGETAGFVLQYDASGTFLKGRQYTTPTRGAVYAGVALSDGTIAVTGQRDGDAFLARWDPTFTVSQWERRFTAVSGAAGYGVTALSDDSVVVAGAYSSNLTVSAGVTLPVQGLSDGFLARFSAEGVHSWSQRIGGSNRDAASALTRTLDGDVVVTGTFQQNLTVGPDALTAPTGAMDVFVARYATASGTALGAVSIGRLPSGDNASGGMALLSDGAVAVAGSFWGAAYFEDTLLTSEGATGIGTNFPSGISVDAFVSRFLIPGDGPVLP